MALLDLPADARPREKLLARGAAALSDTELLALLLRTGLAGKGVMALAQELEPGQTATVSGLLMGFTWGFAGLFYAPIGRLIEAFGVLPVLLGLGVLLLPAWALARGVREPARTMGV